MFRFWKLASVVTPTRIGVMAFLELFIKALCGLVFLFLGLKFFIPGDKEY
jgi:hypothetical protein